MVINFQVPNPLIPEILHIESGIIGLFAFKEEVKKVKLVTQDGRRKTHDDG